MTRDSSPIITPQLINKLKKDFLSEWEGVHGEPHWLRVSRNGLQLAKTTGADTKVIELFAYLHDSQRAHEGHDEHHGMRAANAIDALAGQYFSITDKQLEQLKFACAYHDVEADTDDITVMTCWDADLLDLGRVGVKPDPDRLHTTAAQRYHLLNAAYERGAAWLYKYNAYQLAQLSF